MYSFKIHFQAVFLATTFVTALATPINVPIRRDSNAVSVLTGSFDTAEASTQTLISDIQNLSPTTTQSEAQIFLNHFANLSNNLIEVVAALDSFNLTANQIDSQTLITNSVVPTFVGANNTGATFNQQASIIKLLNSTFGETPFNSSGTFPTNFLQSFQATEIALEDLVTAVNANLDRTVIGESPELHQAASDIMKTWTIAVDNFKPLVP